ncbi:hypothetical protein [Yoonia sp. 208BN28-4]|uniref:hypothetical protein n=1 Tax=Yoonia sp. 208BN28-4 TaxID=3126505 RepID=UPI0030B5284E
MLDPAPLITLFDDMSEPEAEAIVCRALEDIAQRLDKLQDSRASGQFGSVPKTAHRIAAIAGQIGLTSIMTAADHVANAANLQSGVALGATLARLERAFDAAVSEVWSFRQYIGG